MEISKLTWYQRGEEVEEKKKKKKKGERTKKGGLGYFFPPTVLTPTRPLPPSLPLLGAGSAPLFPHPS